MQLIETINSCEFWNPMSQETLIFNNYVGGAAIFEYYNGAIQIQRVNKKYLKEIGTDFSERQLMEIDPLMVMDEENKQRYISVIQEAIKTYEEQECETWFYASCRPENDAACKDEGEKICIRSTIRVIGKRGNRYLFYSMIRNVSDELKRA